MKLHWFTCRNQLGTVLQHPILGTVVTACGRACERIDRKQMPFCQECNISNRVSDSGGVAPAVIRKDMATSAAVRACAAMPVDNGTLELVASKAAWTDANETFELLGAHYASLTLDAHNATNEPSLIGYYVATTHKHLAALRALSVQEIAAKAEVRSSLSKLGILLIRDFSRTALNLCDPYVIKRRMTDQSSGQRCKYIFLDAILVIEPWSA